MLLKLGDYIRFVLVYILLIISIELIDKVKEAQEVSLDNRWGNVPKHETYTTIAIQLQRLYLWWSIFHCQHQQSSLCTHFAMSEASFAIYKLDLIWLFKKSYFPLKVVNHFVAPNMCFEHNTFSTWINKNKEWKIKVFVVVWM